MVPFIMMAVPMVPTGIGVLVAAVLFMDMLGAVLTGAMELAGSMELVGAM